jgi:hypothetical protein
MRGFIFGALILVALDVVLKAPSSRVTQVLATPAAWLAAWTDPRTPLIAGSPSSSTSSTSGLNSGEVPTGHKADSLGEGGSCPASVIAMGLQCADA